MSQIARNYSWQQLLHTVAALSIIQFVIPVTNPVLAKMDKHVFKKINFLNVVSFEYLEMTLKSKD